MLFKNRLHNGVLGVSIDLDVRGTGEAEIEDIREDALVSARACDAVDSGVGLVVELSAVDNVVVGVAVGEKGKKSRGSTVGILDNIEVFTEDIGAYEVERGIGVTPLSRISVLAHKDAGAGIDS